MTDTKKQIAERITDIDHMLEDLVMDKIDNQEATKLPQNIAELDTVEILHNILH